MNTSFYISMKALWSDQRNPSSSPPSDYLGMLHQHRVWTKVWWTLSFLGILLMPSVQAQTGAALNFDGTNDHVTFPTAGLSASAGTMEFWVNTVSNGSTQMYIDLNQEQFTIYSTGTTLRARIAGADLSAPFTPGQWNHLALTWSGNGTTARLYLNGVQVASGTQGSTSLSSSTGYLSRSQGTNAYFVNCTMDEVRLWSVARTATEIATNYCSEIATNSTGLQTYYKFSQGTVGANNAGVTSLTDATSNGRNGTLVSFGLTGTTSNWVSSNTWAGVVTTPSVSIAAAPSGTITGGTSVTFTATPTNGGTPQYQWRRNGTNISGATSATYTTTSLLNGDIITCVMTSNVFCATSATATSNSVTMAVNTAITPTITAVCGTNNGAISLAFAGNLSRVRYVRINQNFNSEINLGEVRAIEAITGTNVAINKTVTSFSTLSGQPNSYFVDGDVNTFGHSNGTGTNEYLEIDLGAEYLLDNIQIVNRGSCCQNRAQDFQLILKNGTGTIINSRQINAYQNQNSGFTTTWNVVDASWSDNATTINRTGLAAGTYTFSYADITGISQTVPVIVTSNNVTPSVSIAGSPSGSIVYGTSTTFTATPTNGGTTPSYQWKKNGTNIGTNSTTYTDAALNNNDVITCVMTSNACASPATATSNSVTMTVTYPAGAALHFDGANDYVNGPKDDALRNMSSLTLEAWIRPTAAQEMMIISYNSNDFGAYVISMSANRKLNFAISNGSSWESVTQTGTISLNTWTHIVGVWSNNTLKVYVNGVLDGTTSSTFTVLGGLYPNDKLRLGVSGWSAVPIYFSGSMDEVRIWNRGLTQCEIQNNMNCELGSGQTGLAAYYKFNQGFGSTSNAGVTSLTDASGNNRTGTLTNFGLTGTTSNWVSTGGVTTGTTCTALQTPSVSIAITTGSQTTCAGASVTFTATPTNGGTTPTYQWKKGGVNIDGATNATYTSTTLANNDAITCVMTSNATCPSTPTATSNSLTMTVNPTVTPSVAIAASATSVPEGTSVTFTATPTNGGTTPTYQWQKGGANISGATSATYTTTSLANGDIITCVMTSNATCVSAATATSNAVTMTVTAPLGAALNFDGVNDYVSAPSGVYFNGDFTIEAWVNPKTYAASSRVIDFGNGPESQNVLLALSHGTSGDPILFVGRQYVFCNRKLTLNTWNHLAVTLRGTTVFFYVNGVEAGTGTIVPPANVVRTTNYIGRSNWEGDAYLNASMDEVRLWNRALPQCEIQNNMNCELPSGQTGLLAYYQFNQGLGNTNNAGMTSVTDASGNNRNGTLTNFGLTGTTSNWIAGGGVTTGTTCTAIPTPSVSIAASATTITGGTSVTFTATPTNGGTTPFYQWKKNNVSVGTNSATYSDAALANGDVISCVMTVSGVCTSTSTATSNAVTITVTGSSPATALNFDGVNDYAAAPAGVYFNGDLTVEAWVYPKSFGSNSRVIDFGNGPDGNNVVLTITNGTSGTPFFHIAGQTLFATKKLTLNAWNHIAATLNGTTVTIYINGVAAGTATFSTPPANVVRNNCYIGRSNWISDAYANANMDELRIWSRALSQCEIQNNMTGELGSGQTGLLAYYKFNQGSVNTNNAGITTLTDASGNSRNGTLNGFGLIGTSSNWISGGGVAAGTTAAAYTAPSVSVSNATTCINTAATLTATATGFANKVTYKWETSTNNTTWSNVTGANATTYAPSTSTAGTRYFRLKATDACGAVYSTGATFTVTNPGLTVTADATQACQGSTVTLTAATVTGTPTYQWQSSADGNAWTNVSGATATTFAPATSTLGTLSYRVVATYGSGCIVNSAVRTLTVNALPTASVTGGNVTVCLNNSNTKLTAVLSNTTGAPVSQWQSSADGTTGWTDIANSNVLTYTPPTTTAGTLYYRLKVTYAATSGLCNVTIYSNVRKVAVLTAPSVTITADNSYCAGTNVTLTSTCSDAAATPTWVGPNNFIASTANITVSNISSTQAGSYKVIYLTETGCVGEKTTSIKLAAELEAAVTKTVSASTIVAGNSAQISLKPIYKQGLLCKIDYGNDKVLTSNSLAVGSQPIYAANDDSPSQQWLFIPVSDNTPNLASSQRFYIKSIFSGLYLRSNPTNSSIVEMATLDNSNNFQWYKGDYYMTNEQVRSVTIGASLVVSVPFYLDKNAFLSSYLVLQNQYANVTERPFSMALSWNDGITTTTRSVSPTTTTSYIATFTSSAGCTIKDTTTITVLPTPTVSVTASATRVCLSQAVTFTATVTNNVNNATYQWQSSANNTAWTNIEDATNDTYSAPTTTTGSVYYRVVMTNILGTFTASGVQITVEAPPSVSISASQTVVCPNGVTTLTATYSTGYGTPTVQWQSSDDGNIWTNIAGATSDTYQPATANNGKKYYRYSVGLPTACTPTFQSPSVAITVNSELTVGISGLATQTVCKGTYRVFTLTTNGAEAKYTWESSTNGTTWTPIANATAASYVAPTTTVGTAYYRGTVISGCSAVSATRQVTVTEAPALTVGSPVSATCIDRAVSFSASVISTSLIKPNYVWQTSTDNLNWATKAGASGTSFVPSAGTVGTIYVRVGAKFASCVDSSFSTSKPFSVRPNPIVTVASIDPSVRLDNLGVPNTVSVCSNSTTVLKATTIGGAGNPKYQWVKSTGSGWVPVWENIANAKDSTYTVVPGSNAAGAYGVKVTYDNCPQASSERIDVASFSAPFILNVTATGTAVCQGSQVDIAAEVYNIVKAYQWQSSPDGTTWTNIANATGASYSYTANTVGTTQYRLVAFANGCNPVTSSVVSVSVQANAVPVLTLSSNNSTLCGDAEVTVTANAANLNGVTPQYEWKRNGQLYVGQNLSFVTKTTSDGLGSNTINDVAIVGNKVYAATDNGLSISTDGGITFINKTTDNGLPNNKITALGLHPDGIRIVVGTIGGAVISRDGGNTFVELTQRSLFGPNRPIKTHVQGIGVSPDGKTVLISTLYDGNFQHDFGESNLTTSIGGESIAAKNIKFKNNSTAYFGSDLYRGLEVATRNSSNEVFYFSSKIGDRNFKRFSFRGDTIFAYSDASNTFASNATFNYFLNNIMYGITGMPKIGGVDFVSDFCINDNVVYATSPYIELFNPQGGLYLSKDGGKSFSDITSSTPGIGTDVLDRIFMGNGRMYITSSAGLKIAASNTPSITFTTNKSDKIECVLKTTGACSNTTSQSLTLNYIADVDPLSIKVAVDGTTGTGTWTAVNNATSYGWELMKFSPDRSSKTFVKNGTVTTNSVTLSDLNPSTNYELTVKTLCNISSAFARLVDVTGSGAGGSTSFTTGFVVPQAIRDSLLKASTLCAEDSLILGHGFPDDYQVNIYSGADKTYIDYASAVHPFKVKLTANTNYFYKVLKSDVKIYTFTASNNDAGSESKRYTVPTGVSKVTFKIAGSKGGGTNGGRGGVTIGTVTPTAGTTYHLFPGTTTTADAGKSRGTAVSFNGGGGSYISTTSLRKDAILVAGGGGASGSEATGGNGGQIGGNGSSGVTGGNATTGGTSFTLTIPANRGTRTPSGFMQGSSIDKVTWNYKYDAGGGGGYYGGGSLLEPFVEPRNSKQAGGGGSSYANTAVVNSVLYENGTNNSTGYVTVYEYSQATANSDFLPLNIVLSPVPVLANAAITLNPANPAYNVNFQGTFSLTGNAGFATSYRWNHSSVKSNIATFNRNSSTGLIGYADVKYCSNRQKTISTYRPVVFSGNIRPDDTSSNRGNRLLTPSVSIASSATNICGGEQVIITATPTNVVDENLFYTWRKNGVDIIGQSDNVLQTSDLANGDVITCTLFYPTATSEIDSAVGTNNVTMTVATPATPKVTIAASANDVCPGTAITFTPTPTAGGTAPQYRWYLNGDLVQTSPTYTSSSFENNDYVECIMVSNATCLAQTESEISTSVSVNLKPTVTPTATVFVSDTLICASSATSLTVRTENAGSTPQYQWRHNGAPVGNNADYYPTSVSNNDAIWCEVTPSADACANTNFIQSNTELIQTAAVGASFTPLATITVDKDSICTGDSLTFSIGGNYLGNAPSFVWKKNSTTLDGTEAFITLKTIANGDIITCVATSSLGCVSTAEATTNALTAKVVAPATPSVSVTTANTTICPNIPVVISATPNYGGILPQYNWKLNNASYNALPNGFFNYTTENGLGGDYTQAVFVRNDTAYAATIGGLSYRVKGDSIYTLSYKDGLATSNVQAIYVDDSGVYAGTDAGLSISTDGLISFRPINTTETGLSSGNITAITAIGSTLFVGTDNGLNISTDGGKSFTTKKTTNGLTSNRIRHLFVDGSTLYVGTEGGLNITSNNGTTFTSKTVANDLNSDTVLGVWAKGATIYAATQRGLAVSTNGGTTFTKLTMENGLPNLQVNSVWVVGDSMVYAATSGGLGISKNGGKTFRGYYQTDTLGSNTVLGVTVASGRIYAATTGGLSISDPSKIRVYPNDGDVFATNLASNKSCVATSTATSNNLTFFVGSVSAASLDATIVRNTSATLTWTGTVGSYNWLVVPTGTGLNGTVVASGTTATMPITVTGLTVLTTYDLFVQGACTPDGTVDWVGPLTFTTTNNAFVSVKTLLHGAYDATTGLMNDNLRSLNLVPTTEPYTGMTGFTHVNGGGEKTSSTVLAVTGNDAIVDWVFVELRDKMTSGTVIATRSALIQRDGDVVDVDGISPVSFNVASDDYYISVRHRNHLGVRTTSAVTLDKVTAAPYDFTTAANKAMNSIQKDLTGGKFGMYAGNINGDNIVRASGSLSINDYLKLIGLLGSSSSIQTNVYSVGDVNMDGTMRASGSLSLNDYLKIINAIGSAAGIITQPF